MTIANEHARLIGKRLGRRVPSNRPAIHFGHILSATVPTHPFAVTSTDQVPDWDVRGNDQYGDCGPVSVANALALTSTVLSGHEDYPDLTAVLDLYRRSGNPGFPADDDGVVMQDMLAELLRDGIRSRTGVMVKPVAYAKVNVGNLDEVRAAIAIFGGVLLGVNLQQAQEGQSDDIDPVWDYVATPEWGGHAVFAADYTSLTGHQADIGFVSWGDVMALTDLFWTHQVDEAWVVVWPQNLGTAQFQEGIDLTALARDYLALTGRVLPILIPPAPPTPPPAPGNWFLAEIERIWNELGELLRHWGHRS